MDRIQNIAIASTPSEDLARHIRDIPTLRFGDNEYEVTAYIAAPDDAARGVAPTLRAPRSALKSWLTAHQHLSRTITEDERTLASTPGHAPAPEGHKGRDRGNGLPQDQGPIPGHDQATHNATRHQQHSVNQQTTTGNIDHNLIEILPAKRGQMSIFVLNVYSPPSRRKENFAYLLAATFKLAKQNGVVILGDFNAAHPAWGYGKATVKGNKLWELIHQQGLTVHTDPACPTRIGNSVSRDTCPDLTMTKRLADAEWCNTEETLGNDPSIQALTNFFNQHWEEGTLPAAWKHADIILIPKTGKPPKLENLRPISLTSCIGKLFEHVILNRLQPYVENNNLLPPTIFGFRPHLSTQDILLQLHEDINRQVSAHSTRAILTLDLKGAFDNVSHDIILTNLSDLNCGQRTFAYIQAFLQNRTATIGIGDLRTQPLPTPNRGTPQGAVLSPMLFNVAMMKLPAQLAEIEGVYHALYADDITIWATSGSDGEIQDALQRATDVVQRYAPDSAAMCSETGVIGLCLFCLVINAGNLVRYALGHYRDMVASGSLFDLAFGIECILNSISDYMLISALSKRELNRPGENGNSVRRGSCAPSLPRRSSAERRWFKSIVT
ncbi:uncharacterized protein ISCGN_009738 [Ixodes scapularis]